jgi:hypothetical protein
MWLSNVCPCRRPAVDVKNLTVNAVLGVSNTSDPTPVSPCFRLRSCVILLLPHFCELSASLSLTFLPSCLLQLGSDIQLSTLLYDDLDAISCSEQALRFCASRRFGVHELDSLVVVYLFEFSCRLYSHIACSRDREVP